MRRYALFAGLAAVACAGASPGSEQHTLSTGTIACTLDGEGYVGVSAENACEIFRRAFAAESTLSEAEGLRIALTAHAGDRAHAVVTDGRGTVLVDLDFDVMDAALSAATWEQFARTVAREVARARTS